MKSRVAFEQSTPPAGEIPYLNCRAIYAIQSSELTRGRCRSTTRFLSNYHLQWVLLVIDLRPSGGSLTLDTRQRIAAAGCKYEQNKVTRQHTLQQQERADLGITSVQRVIRSILLGLMTPSPQQPEVRLCCNQLRWEPHPSD
jgi:hypothetical protein